MKKSTLKSLQSFQKTGLIEKERLQKNKEKLHKKLQINQQLLGLISVIGVLILIFLLSIINNLILNIFFTSLVILSIISPLIVFRKALNSYRISAPIQEFLHSAYVPQYIVEVQTEVQKLFVNLVKYYNPEYTLDNKQHDWVKIYETWLKNKKNPNIILRSELIKSQSFSIYQDIESIEFTSELQILCKKFNQEAAELVVDNMISKEYNDPETEELKSLKNILQSIK